MVGPHDGELEPLSIRRVKKAFFECALKEGAIAIPVPVEDECIQPMIGSGIDFLRENLRVGFVLISPERNLWLMVARESRSRVFDQVPLCPLWAVGVLVARIDVIVAEVIGGDLILRGSIRNSRWRNACQSGCACRAEKHSSIHLSLPRVTRYQVRTELPLWLFSVVAKLCNGRSFDCQ